MSIQMKHDYLVVYDYGTGGVWSVIAAYSKEQVQARFPDLEVVDVKPEWMTGEMYDRIRSTLFFDIDTLVAPLWLRERSAE